MKNCTKPNCDCYEKEEQKLGHPPKYGYPCLRGDYSEFCKDFKPHEIPANWQEWIKEQAEGRYPTSKFYQELWTEAAAAMLPFIEETKAINNSYAEKIKRQNERIESLEREIDGEEAISRERAALLNELQQQIEEKDKEVVGLKGQYAALIELANSSIKSQQP